MTNHADEHAPADATIPAPARAITGKANFVAFREALARHLLVSNDDRALFDRLPPEAFTKIWEHNFRGNLALAERLFRHDAVNMERQDRARLLAEKLRIHGVNAAVALLQDTLAAGHPVAFLTDFDNDGSLSQAVIRTYQKTLPKEWAGRVTITYAQPLTETRGFCYEMVERLAASKQWERTTPFLLITADNGINNRAEWERIRAAYPNARLVVTDHHLPDADVIVEDAATVVVNPAHTPTPYFTTHNISGADTVHVLLREHLATLLREDAATIEHGHLPDRRDVVLRPDVETAQHTMADLGRWGNLLDYAATDLADKPVQTHSIDVALRLQSLLNTVNATGSFIRNPWGQDEEAILRRHLPPPSADTVMAAMAAIANLNRIARRLLEFHERYRAEAVAWTEADFSDHLARAWVTSPGPEPDPLNSNALEQLRPYIFEYRVRPTTVFESGMADLMEDVYGEMRGHLRAIQEQVRQTPLTVTHEAASATLFMPIDPEIGRLFSRRFLGLTYNQENRGILVNIDKMEGQHARGSVRSAVPLTSLSKLLPDLERAFGVRIRFRGHDHAAGIEINVTPPRALDRRLLQDITAWLSRNVDDVRAAAPVVAADPALIAADLTTLPFLARIQNAVGANLSNMEGLDIVLHLPDAPPDHIWLTDADTTAAVRIGDVLLHRRNGFIRIPTDFDGGTVIVPVEILRAAVAEHPHLPLRLKTLNHGAWIVDGIERARTPGTTLTAGRLQQEALLDAMRTDDAARQPIRLARADFATLPYFRHNRFGAREFADWEALTLAWFDATGADGKVIIDTEASGLGRAPKCFNIGALLIRPDPASGRRMPLDVFEAGCVVDGRGRHFWLTPEQRAVLTRVPVASEEPSPGDVVLLADRDGRLASHVDRWWKPAGDLLEVTNRRIQGDSVVLNRSIMGEAVAYLVREDDLAITPEFEHLTGIGNRMLEAAGLRAATVDQRIVGWLARQRNEHGQPARLVYTAHNLPYDRSVVAANFKRFAQVLDRSLLEDTAKIARSAALVYDSSPLAAVTGLPGVRGALFFHASPTAPVSVRTFIERARAGRGARLPDRTGRYVLTAAAGDDKILLIDTAEHTEIVTDLAVNDPAVMDRFVPAPIPGNAMKYSVERMSIRAMARNIMLWNEEPRTHIDLLEDERPFESLVRYYQDQYHFDASPEDNVAAFDASLSPRIRDAFRAAVVMDDVTERFLAVNGALLGKFHSGWMYESVLMAYDPPAATRHVPRAIIDQIEHSTHLPGSVIRNILAETIKFKRDNGIDHALVHEEHNNLRFRSPDGTGLADIVYESVLPGFLLQNRQRNPYASNPTMMVECLVKANVVAAMHQDALGREYAAHPAENAYSMQQADAYDRRAIAGRIADLQDRPHGATGQEIKLSMPEGVTMDGSAVYAVTRRAVSSEDIDDSVARLAEIIANEQVISSVNAATRLDRGHADALLVIAYTNQERLSAHRAVLDERFCSVTLERRDANLREFAEWLQEIAGICAGHPEFDLDRPEPAEKGDTEAAARNKLRTQATTMRFGAAQADAIRNVFRTTLEAHRLLGLPPLPESVQRAVVLMLEAAPSPVVAASADGKTKTKGKSKTESRPPAPAIVRSPEFLPDIDIRRRNPMKTVLGLGMERFLGEALARQERGDFTPQDIDALRAAMARAMGDGPEQDAPAPPVPPPAPRRRATPHRGT